MSLFDPQRNSFGLLRLVLAVAVVVSHAWPLGGFGSDPGRQNNNLGILAVECFFALSGFLIARSGEKLSVGRFLWHRIVRIFPALWVVILAVALIFAPVVWSASSHSVARYVAAHPGPLGYIMNNIFLQNAQQTIGTTLSNNPFPGYWNGPLYTLPFEFTCYLVIAMLMAFRILSPRITAAIAVVSWVWLQLQEFGLAGPSADSRQARFTLCFFVGALIYQHRERVLNARRWWLLAAAVLVAVGTYLTYGFLQVGVVAFVFVFLWLGCVLPLRKVAAKHDISYGIYIYGWPVAQVAAFFSVPTFGLKVYLPVVLAGTVCLAVASWFLIESPALRWKSARPPGWAVERLT